MQLEGLEESVIPVESTSRTYRIKFMSLEGKAIIYTIKHHQFPMMPAYVFTDYH